MKKIAKLTAFGEDRYEESDWQDSVPGGKADKKTPMDFDPARLSEGLKIELEHTDDRKLALEIAMDHLTEDEDYYRKLKKIEKKASVRLLPPRALSGFADEMTKVALPGLGASLTAAALLGPSKTSMLGKLVRLLATPIPGTPKLFMKVRNKQQLDALETKVREKARDLTNENIAKLLRKLKVDKIFQKLEPVLGSTTAPKAYRDTFGARKVHELAHRPIYSLLGYSPIPYATSVSGAAAGLAEKYLGLAPPRSFKMPGEAAKGVQEAAKDIVQGAAKPSAMQRVKFKIPEAAKIGLVAGVPAAAIAAGDAGKEKTASIKERAGRVLKDLLDEAGEAVTQKAKQQKQELVDEMRSAIQGGRGVIDEAIQQSVGKAMGQVAPHLDSLIQRNLHAAQPQIDQALQKATKNLVTEGIARAKAEAAPVLRRLGQQALAGGISGGIGGAVQGNERSDVVRGAALGAALSPLSFGAGRKVSERLLKNRSEGARQLATAGIGSALTGLGLGYGISR